MANLESFIAEHVTKANPEVQGLILAGVNKTGKY
jgi:hypothetical protein